MTATNLADLSDDEMRQAGRDAVALLTALTNPPDMIMEALAPFRTDHKRTLAALIATCGMLSSAIETLAAGIDGIDAADYLHALGVRMAP